MALKWPLVLRTNYSSCQYPNTSIVSVSNGIIHQQLTSSSTRISIMNTTTYLNVASVVAAHRFVYDHAVIDIHIVTIAISPVPSPHHHHQCPQHRFHSHTGIIMAIAVAIITSFTTIVIIIILVIVSVSIMFTTPTASNDW